MKTFIFKYLSVICIGIFLGHVQTAAGSDVDELSACDHVSYKIDVLKSSNENLKQDIERYQHDVERKFYTIEAQQNDNLKELKQLFSSMDKHSKSIAVTHVLLEFLSNKVKDNSKVCVRSNDQTLVCTAVVYPTNCVEYDAGHCANGKCRIQNKLYGSESFLVSCDDITDGGGWTVIQRRINGSIDFYRGWSEYKKGFGNLDSEFWIGLDKLHALTTSLAPVELLIQLKDHNDVMKYAKYGKFSVGSESEMYELKEADDYEGNAGDSFGEHEGHKFTTKDKDNDESSSANCAVFKRGAWWYEKCGWSSLNGIYYENGDVPENEKGRGINWGKFNGFDYSLKFVQMMIRPKRS